MAAVAGQERRARGPRPETLGAIPRREESGAGLSRAFKLLEQAPLSCETSLRKPKFKGMALS
ncbi:LOW QUALITY PROTEIN: CLN6 isoform 20, partial [Pongo abelii]